MKYTDHTAVPWILESKGWDGQFIYGQDIRVNGDHKRFIASVSLSYDGAEANAKFIVRAVNAHDDLVKALRAFVVEFEQRDGDFTDAENARYLAARSAVAKAGEAGEA
jgi:hypothetical protein